MSSREDFTPEDDLAVQIKEGQISHADTKNS